jgi:hypothetical protein
MEFTLKKQPPPLNLVLGDDDSTASRDAVVKHVKVIAHKLRFSHCEVRDYTNGLEGHYIPLYGGPLRGKSAS